MKVLALFLALSACSFDSNPSKDAEPTRKQELEARYKERVAELTAIYDWSASRDCDWTLWAGIASVSVPVDLDLAEYAPGEIHRRPAPSCWTEASGDQGAKSTVSNDMLIGYMWGRYETGDLAALQRLADYGTSHDWFMGLPKSMASRVLMKPNQIAMLGRAIYALSNGEDDRAFRNTPIYYAYVAEDYERHIQALGIILQGRITEKIGDLALTDVSDNALARLKELAEAEPGNPGYLVAYGVYTGDMTRAVDILLADQEEIPSYVRGENPTAYWLAEWTFWAKIALERMTDG